MMYVIQRSCTIFKPLTQFEQLISDVKKQLSEIYAMPLSLLEVTDGVKRKWGMEINEGISDSDWGHINYFDCNKSVFEKVTAKSNISV